MYDKDVSKNNRKGMVQIYTGSGKGKTTAALGLAFRALGHGKKVLLIQFMKKGKDLGELKAARRFNKFKILQTGPVKYEVLSKKTNKKRWPGKGAFLSSKARQLAQRGLVAAQKALEENEYDVIILDELNVAIEFGLLQLQEVKEILRNKPKRIEVVITGRYAHPEILEIADLVSEVRELKHYYKKGITARIGIEY